MRIRATTILEGVLALLKTVEIIAATMISAVFSCMCILIGDRITQIEHNRLFRHQIGAVDMVSGGVSEIPACQI